MKQVAIFVLVVGMVAVSANGATLSMCFPGGRSSAIG